MQVVDVVKVLRNWKLVRYSLNRGYEVPVLSTSMRSFIDLHEEYGYPWDIVPVIKKNFDHFESDSVFRGLRYLEDIAQQPPLSQINICFEIVRNDSINAFATKVHEGKKGTYLIAINSGMVIEYVDHFTHADTVERILKDFQSLSQIPIKHLQESALALAFCFVSFHELGHIVRGHLDFMNEEFGVQNWTELSSHGFQLEKASYGLSRHLFECDADAFAGSLMVGEIMSRYKNGMESGMIKGPPERLLEELIVFTGAVTHYIFCLFDRYKTKHNRWYPVPPIRSAVSMAHMAAQLAGEGYDETELQVYAIDALLRARSAIDSADMVQATGAEDLKTEFPQWVAKYKEKLERISEFLVPYTPVSRTN